MPWEVEATDEYATWFNALSEEETQAVIQAVDQLAQDGPVLGRPLVDTIHGSRLSNLKELRPQGRTIRILFVFDPRRVAILLLGGDKRGQWMQWYKAMIPRAERLYDEYLAELRREGLLR